MGAKRIGHNRVNPVAPTRNVKNTGSTCYPLRFRRCHRISGNRPTEIFRTAPIAGNAQTTARPAQDIKEAKWGDGYAALRPWHHTAGGRTCRLRLAFQICCPTFPEPRPGKRGESTTRVKRRAFIQTSCSNSSLKFPMAPLSAQCWGPTTRGDCTDFSRRPTSDWGRRLILTSQRLVRRDCRCSQPLLGVGQPTACTCLRVRFLYSHGC